MKRLWSEATSVIYNYITFWRFCQVEILHKISLSFSQNLVQYSNLIFLIIYDNILVSRGERNKNRKVIQWTLSKKIKKPLDKRHKMCYNKYVPKGTKSKMGCDLPQEKEMLVMANKKTVVQMYKEILAIPSLNAEQKAFIEKRIEITEKKNANRSAEPTPKQLEKMALETEIENAVVSAMSADTEYTVSDLVKLIARADVLNPQKLTPRLTALVEANKVVKATVKGRSVYSLPKAE